MRNRFLPAVLILSLLSPEVAVWAQSRPSPKQKSSATKPAVRMPVSSKSTAKKKTVARKKTRKRISAARVRRVTRAFVASADLKPMARQLLENRTAAAYAGVESFAQKHAGKDEAALAWLAIGYARILDKEWDKALPALRKAKSRAGDLGDYVSYLTAMSQGALGQGEEVLSTLSDFEKTWPESIFARDVLAIYGNALTAAGKPAEAIAFLETYRSPMRADVELALARAYVKTGNTTKGVDILRRLFYTMPLSAEASQAQSDLSAIAATTPIPPAKYEDRRTRAGLLAAGNRWSDAASEYRTLAADAPPEDKASMQVALGVALRRSGNHREGRKILESTDASHNSAANGQRLYNLGEIARSEEDEDDVLENLEKMRQQTPTSSWFEQALLSAANMYLLKRDYDKAIDHYREIHERFPTASRAAYAHWKAAWLNYRQGRKDQAKKEFIEQVEQYPASAEVPAAIYWRARIAEDEGDLVTAKLWYTKVADRFRNYYYGYIARERLSQLRGGAVPASDPVLSRVPRIQPFKPDAHVTDAPEDELRVAKSKLLENGGLFEFAIKELQAADGGRAPNWATLQIARIYQDNGQPHRALQTLKRAVPGYFAIDITSLPRPYWEGLFPRSFWTDVKKYSTQNGLDPHVVASLIRQESEFNPGAVSHANALGLMQLLPRVGKSEARALKVRGFSTGMLFSPTTNIQLGTRHFKQMVDKYNGQVEYALAAYNAGSHRVDDWRSASEYRDMPEFVESIPFTETREYVQAIVRNAQIYRRLYSSD